MNGRCPSPTLKMDRNSRIIHNSPSSFSSSSSSTSFLSSSSSKVTQESKVPKRPVIIYAQSPKIIHTHPRNFMALVQKLTGISRHDDEKTETSNLLYERQPENTGEDIISKPAGQEDDNESSSAITENNFGASRDAQVSTSGYYRGANTSFFDDIPRICSNSSVFWGSSGASTDILSR